MTKRSWDHRTAKTPSQPWVGRSDSGRPFLSYVASRYTKTHHRAIARQSSAVAITHNGCRLPA